MKPEEVKKLFDKLEREVNPDNITKRGYEEVHWQLSILRPNYPYLYRMIKSLYGLERIS